MLPVKLMLAEITIFHEDFYEFATEEIAANLR